VTATAANFAFLVEDPFYKDAYFKAVKTAFFSTLMALLIGYPMAYVIARATPRWRNTMLMLVVLPFWTSFLIRVYSWKVLLQGSGPINALLMYFGFIDEPVQILYTDVAIYIGIVYSYLPFMVLPLCCDRTPDHAERGRGRSRHRRACSSIRCLVASGTSPVAVRVHSAVGGSSPEMLVDRSAMIGRAEQPANRDGL
jgi:hypothetical protein